MEEIKLEPGWLKRQMDDVLEQTKNWPKSLDFLRNINKEITDKYATKNPNGK